MALFYLLILLLPAQLGRHWWPQWSLVNGIRIDYLAPTLYLTDILLLMAAAGLKFNLIRDNFRRGDSSIPVKLLHGFTAVASLLTGFGGAEPRTESHSSTGLHPWLSGAWVKQPAKTILLIFIASFYFLFLILRSERPILALYWTARYLEIPLMAIVTSWGIKEFKGVRGMERMGKLGGREGIGSFKRTEAIRKILTVGIIFLVGLEAAQIFFGRTTGWFWILGERSFNISTPGIATIAIRGREILRPYATFGHPNALAGYLAVASLLQFSIFNFSRGTGFLAKPRQFSKKKAVDWRSPLAIGLGILGVILTASRGALAGLVMAGLFKIRGLKLPSSPAVRPPEQVLRGAFRRAGKIKSLLMGTLGILGVLGVLGILGFWGNLGDAVKFASEAEKERLILARAAMEMWKDSWLLGVGPGQFLVKLPEYLPGGSYQIQPVHNVFLLILAELGAVGMAIGLIGLIRLIRRINDRLNLKIWLPVLAVIVTTGMADHYWLTAPQNRLLLGLVMGMLISRSRPLGAGKQLRGFKGI